MLDMNNNFIKLNSQFQSLNEVREYIFSKDHTWNNIGYGFDVLNISQGVIIDPVVDKIMKEFGVKSNIFRTPANYWYKWHVDADRTAALNIEIWSGHSHTVYGEDAEHSNKKNIEELVYEPGGMYLLNTQSTHSVLNLGETRYVLGLGFKLPHTYNTIRDYFVSNSL
jgi:hypothetical protein